MKVLGLIFAIFSFSLLAEVAVDPHLKSYCDKLDGKVVSRYKCPNTNLVIPFGFCVFKNKSDETLFFDGCTGPSGGNSKRFYPHCINHDLCYHHEPITSGKTQKDCDQEMLSGMIKSCESSPKVKSCKRWAKSMYRALRTFGKLAYSCANYEVSEKLPDFSQAK